MKDDEIKKIKELSLLIHGSFRWKVAYQYMRFLMFIESFLWTLMDIVRYKRERVAKRINRNYNNRL